MSLRDKMLAVMADVNSAVSEREELVELIAIALLTRKNLFSQIPLTAWAIVAAPENWRMKEGSDNRKPRG